MTPRHYALPSLCFIWIVALVPTLSTLWADAAHDFAQADAYFLEQYCFSCHAGEQPAAELPLDSLSEQLANPNSDNLALIENWDVWELVLDMVTTSQMPPHDSEQPAIVEVESFVQYIEAIFERAKQAVPPDPGRITVRRLNKVEYRNTVRDLLGVDFDPTQNFPADGIGYGFDTIGDVLSLSPLLMEAYLRAAEVIAARVILVDAPPPVTRYQNVRRLDPRHKDIPETRFRLLDPTADVAWKTGPFTTGGAYLKFAADAEVIYRAVLSVEEELRQAPLTDEQPPVKVALFVQGEALEEVSTVEELGQLVGVDLTKHNGIKILETFEITARNPKQPQTIETLVSRIAHVEKAGIAMVKPAAGEPTAKLRIHRLGSKGPLDTRPASHHKILACTSDLPQAAQTREVLSRLLRRAYRRVPTQQEVENLAQFAESIQADGEKWEASIQAAIKVVLCSPKFLFRWELEAPGKTVSGPYPIDEFQLASRLSYFLWSSMPDDELLALAEEEQLTANLEAQVKRMLADPRASELARNFGTQWLQIQRLGTVAPDPARFPTFTRKLRQAMLKETEFFLDSIFREDRSLLELLDADYTFLNQPLANHYGMVDTQGNWMGLPVSRPGGEKIRGDAFRRVALQSRSRGGILTHASVLTVTSNPTRTSPVKRGRWVLEQVLGSPPPPPPPDVPELAEEHETVRGTTLRERLEQHRKDPGCANCHAQMDALGFALENYNAIGAFRTKDGDIEIDTTATLPDGTSFQGIADLKEILKDRKERFVRCLAEKMLTYALGRGLAYYDRLTLDRIVAQLEAQDYRSSVLITEIVKSEPFRLRRGTKEKP